MSDTRSPDARDAELTDLREKYGKQCNAVLAFYNYRAHVEMDLADARNQRDAALAALGVAREALDSIDAYAIDWTVGPAQNVAVLQDIAVRALSRIAALLPALQPVAQPRTPADDDKVKRTPGCRCHWEEGDSECPVHDAAQPRTPVCGDELDSLEHGVSCVLIRGHGGSHTDGGDVWSDEHVQPRTPAEKCPRCDRTQCVCPGDYEDSDTANKVSDG